MACIFQHLDLLSKSKGWEGSVDLEAYEAAGKMGVEIRFLETIEEQVRVLEQIPVERMTRFPSAGPTLG